MKFEMPMKKCQVNRPSRAAIDSFNQLASDEERADALVASDVLTTSKLLLSTASTENLPTPVGPEENKSEVKKVHFNCGERAETNQRKWTSLSR